jgi:hypothetical protein
MGIRLRQNRYDRRFQQLSIQRLRRWPVSGMATLPEPPDRMGEAIASGF